MRYDILIIGGGAAGLTCAYTAKGFNKKVGIIEKNRTGGECTWSGCIPSKALINIGKEIHIAKKYADINIDSKKILNRVREVIKKVYKEEDKKRLEEDGIDLISGTAIFESPKKIDVDGKKYEADKIIIATGSLPFVPPIPGIKKVGYLTNEDIFELEELPKSMIVLGGGAIGVELSQALNRLGVEVYLVEMMESILFREEREFAQILSEKLKEEGVNVLDNTKAISVEEIDGKVSLTVENNGQKRKIQGDSILVAVGRKPNYEGLGLDNIGIKKTKKAIVVDTHLETTVKGVYACGDIVGPYQFSHMANYQGIIATMNSMFPLKKKVDYSHVAWCTFTDPEFAHAGYTEEEARKEYGDGIKIYKYDYNKLDRVKTKNGSIGKVKVIVDKKAKVLGAHIVGDRAGEIISQIQTLKTLNIPISKLQKVIHPYPTYGDVLRQIGKEVYLDRIMDNTIVKGIKDVLGKGD